MASASPSSQVKSATRTLDIIEYVVAQRRALVAQEIATALGIPVSSLSYLLATLVDRQYLIREGRRYRPGPGLERLQAHDGGFTLAERVAPLVRTLRVQLNETASFFVRHGWEAEAIVTETSEQALRYAVNSGTRTPLHALSAGKALLSGLSAAELDSYFAEGERYRFTEKTVSDEASLRAELEEIRRTGLAHTDEEYSLGIAGIGRLVLIDGEAAGALAVAVPKVRFDAEMEQRVTDLLNRTAALLEAS
ncbi:MAG: IclR family transcriptional regulator [Sphingomonadaceae bacterium]|nr:IclR family transcriptional regulator [Sphingomonadaceae bacterium]